MIRSALVGLVSALAVVVAIVACSAAQQRTELADLKQLGVSELSCVSTQILSGGVEDPAQIAFACGGLALASVFADVRQLELDHGALDASIDAGAAHLARLARIHAKLAAATFTADAGLQ